MPGHLRRSAVAVLLPALLAGCGGGNDNNSMNWNTADGSSLGAGGGSPPVVTTPTPTSAPTATPTPAPTPTPTPAPTATPTPTPAPPAPTPTPSPTPAPTPAPAANCSQMALCEDFESTPAGSGPDASRWVAMAPNCSDNSGSAVVDTTQFRSGGKSMRIVSGANYCGHTFMGSNMVASMGNVVWGRYYMRLGQALGDAHITFMSMCDSTDAAARSGDCSVSTINNQKVQTKSKELRMGGQSGIVMWNRELDDATVPSLSPAGIAMSTRLTPNEWHCVEFGIDQAAGSLQTWIDGVALPGLQIDASATNEVDANWLRNGNWRPALKDIKFGWEQYSGAAGATVWFDDVALHTSRIGCN